MIDFPQRWPVNNPDIIQLYTMATPNGQKVSIMLEEIGAPYEAHLVNILENDQFDDDYLKINPNNKIPALVDPYGPDGDRIALMESGAILMYLADKSGMFLPGDLKERWETLQWLFFQTGHVGPMFGQFGHFYKFAADKTADRYAVERFTKESQRILGVLEKRLENRKWIMGEEVTIADMAIAPWIKGLDWYDGHEMLETTTFKNVMNYRDRFYARPTVEKGAQVCMPDL